MRRRIYIAIAFALLVVLVLVFLSQSYRSATATDGREVTIAKVTYGTEHSFDPGKPWMRVLRLIMGPQWAARRGSYTMRFTNDVPALMVWTQWEQTYRTNSLPVEATVLDEHGTESELTLSRWNVVPMWRNPADVEPKQAYAAWMFKNFPRRAGTLRLRIYDRDPQNAPAQTVEIAFGNPAPRKFPQWRGEQLPIHQTVDRFEFLLTKLLPISNALWQASFEVRTHGNTDYSWQIGKVEATDATANFLSARSNIFPVPTTNLHFVLKGALWPEEPAWKLAVEFCRVLHFEPQELWVLRVPAPTRAQPFQIKTNLPAPGSNIFEMTMEATYEHLPLTRGGIRRNGHLLYQLRPAQTGPRLFLLKIEDEQRRQMRIEPGYVSPDGLHTFGLQIPRDAQTLDLTFGIRKSTIVEFVVNSKGHSAKSAANPK
jgi:hypothetical protein